jgi:hypothetical protein
LAFFQVLICNAGLPYSALEVDSTGLIQNTNVTVTFTNAVNAINNKFYTTNTIITMATSYTNTAPFNPLRVTVYFLCVTNDSSWGSKPNDLIKSDAIISTLSTPSAGAVIINGNTAIYQLSLPLMTTYWRKNGAFPANMQNFKVVMLFDR